MSITLKCRSFGTKPLLYHWETRDSNNQTWMINGYTSIGKILSLKAVQSTSQARCIVSNECGVAISHTATITVFSKSCMAVLSSYLYAYTPPIEITSHPQSKQAVLGSTVSLMCASSGSVSYNVKFM